MAHKVADRISDTTTTSGTGDITVSGTAPEGYQTPSAVATVNGDTFDVVIAGGTQWEVTRLTRVSANVYSRATPYSSSTGSAINFSAGTKEVWGDIPAFFARHLNTVEIAVASAATCDIGAVHGLKVEISGTTTITSLGTVANQMRMVRFSGVLTLTHNGTSLILPGAANIVTTAGDTAIFMSDGSGNWRCWNYQRAAGVRERLGAARTYFVRTDGSDSNTGLVDSAGGAFLTLQKAVDVISSLDIATHAVTIDAGDGTYTAGLVVNGPWLGSGGVSLVGNTGTPANVIINPPGGVCVHVKNGGSLLVSGFEARGNVGLFAEAGGAITVSTAVRFGACTAYQLYASDGSITFLNDYSVVGGAINHVQCDPGGLVRATSITVTFSGTPAFSGTFLSTAGAGAQCTYFLNTFSPATGAFTGSRYSATSGGVINVNGAGVNYLPGSAAGSGTDFGVTPWGLYA